MSIVVPDSGAFQFFKKMDVGSLDIADILGTSLFFYPSPFLSPL